MTVKEFFEKVYLRLPLRVILLVEVLQYWARLCHYNASFATDRDMHKMQYTLMRENHVIEKGMSMKNTKKGFGQAKVKALIRRLELYNTRYGKTDHDFMLYPLSTIHSYILYQKEVGVDIQEIEGMFETLCQNAFIVSDSLDIPAGIKQMYSSVLQSEAKGDFKSLLYSRHSIRYFKEEHPDRDIIEEALELASRTPSACNRQAWHTHVYFDDDAHKLLKAQGGCNGFYNDVPCCIVVTADMKGFLSYEPFQCYIDGGLYAQNLINALHYTGLGAIPLSCGFLSYRLLRIQRQFNIPENEVMVVIIGLGYMHDSMKIAISTRKDISTTNTFHTN